MFVDKVKVKVVAGNGGDGIVSFRREKFIQKGGPDGGDGGHGGNVIVVASANQDTLATFRYKKTIKASDGQSGGKRKKHGKNGQDAIVHVPVGTVISDEAGSIIADLAVSGEESIIAHGGSGGFGNAHFTSSTRQAPRLSEKGEKGEQLELVFELKMIADVGLIGLPNAGKSTLLSRITNAKPEIADYPFTTLSPNLGVVDMYGSTGFIVADIPGLIEGASQGRGLGDEFLRHIERTSILIHVVDAYVDDAAGAYSTVRKELKAYSKELIKKPELIVLNKTEGLDNEIKKDIVASVQKVAAQKAQIFAISAQSGQGIEEVLKVTNKKVQSIRQARQKKLEKEIPILRFTPRDSDWTIEEDNETFIVMGAKIERFARRTDFDNPHGVDRLRDIMNKMGISKALQKRGIEPGATIVIGKPAIGAIVY